MPPAATCRHSSASSSSRLPYLLRGPRLLGRWGALTASFLLLVSPTILYQSRYIRHDIYTVVGSLLLFICHRPLCRSTRAALAGDRRRHRSPSCSPTTRSSSRSSPSSPATSTAPSSSAGCAPGGRTAATRLPTAGAPRRGALVLAARAVRRHAVRVHGPHPRHPLEQPDDRRSRSTTTATSPRIRWCSAAIAVVIAFFVGLRMILRAARDPERSAEGWPDGRSSATPRRAPSRPRCATSRLDRTGVAAALTSPRSSSSRSSPACSPTSTASSARRSPPTARCSTGSASTTTSAATNPGSIS